MWPAQTNRGPAVVTADIIPPRTIGQKSTVEQEQKYTEERAVNRLVTGVVKMVYVK